MTNKSRFFQWLRSPRFLRNSLLALAVILTLGTVFYAFENWRAARAWDEIRAERKAAGLPNDWTEVIPAPVPDLENFCALPLFKKINPANPALGKLSLDDGNPDRPFPEFKYEAGKVHDLDRVAEYYRNSPSFPQAPAHASSAEIILAALGKYDPERKELIQGLNRPQAIFPVDYSLNPPWEIAFPHLNPVMSLSKMLNLHAVASLAAGKNADALDDIRIQFRLAEAMSREPVLISHLVEATIINISMRCIWEGLHRSAWTVSELNELDRLLSTPDLLRSARQGFEGEQILFFSRTVDFLKTRSISQNREFLGLIYGMNETPSLYAQTFSLISSQMPRGWYDQNKILAFRLYRDHITGVINLPQRRVDVKKAEALQSILEEEKKHLRPTNFLVAITLPSVSNALQSMLVAQANLDLTRIVCALEIYKRTEGKYPANLSQLGRVLPGDPLSGQAYRYLSQEGKTFKLWSVGWNQKDEGGTIAYRNKEQTAIDRTAGDWVWPYFR